MQKKTLLNPTPFLIFSVPAVLYVLFELVSSSFVIEGWVYRMVNFLLPVALIMIVADVLLKYLITKTAQIWIVELILSLGFVYYWIVT